MHRRQFTTRALATLGTGGLVIGGQPAFGKTGGRMTQPSMGDGFYVPAEELPHHATFMQWPNDRRVYRDEVFLRMTQESILNIANTISAFEPVYLMADGAQHAALRPRLSRGVELWDIPTNDLWCRDAGQLFAVNDAGEMIVRGIQFNGWGNKQPHDHDAKIAKHVAQTLGLRYVPTALKGEPGGVEQDGHGLLMAHKSSWLIDNRNPNMSLDDISGHLLAAYGADRIIWADGVWDEDITDYHIDSLARFTGPNRAIINLPDDPDPDDPFHMAALDTHDILRAAGVQLDVIPEPHTRRVNSYDFLASYANFYVCNGAVITAQYGDPDTDALAQQTLARHYFDREVIMLNVDTLGELGGGIHCATQQMPKT